MTASAELADDDVTCWWCGVEPDDTITAETVCGTVSVFYRWPAAGDHEHSPTPPSPHMLARAGDRALANSLRLLTD